MTSICCEVKVSWLVCRSQRLRSYEAQDVLRMMNLEGRQWTCRGDMGRPLEKVWESRRLEGEGRGWVPLLYEIESTKSTDTRIQREEFNEISQAKP